MRFIVDVNDFHKKKIENLKTLAHMLSERAKYFKSSIETDTMPAFDRKIIHEFLADKPNIKTESSGIEPNRRVVIRYIENIA
jgi:spoIIIJ-associated protein